MFGNISQSLAKTLMKLCPYYPDEDNLNLQEIFNHDTYTRAPIEEQKRIQLQSSQYTYDYESEIGYFDWYFPHVSSDDFRNKSILDLGCFTGGRLVRWVERYGFAEGRGIDVDPIYAEAGTLFAKHKGVNAFFSTGFGESLPYDNNQFDFVVSYDVFEHVRDVERVMQECFRVLKPGGKLLAVFPQFFHPLEAHLGLVTKTPGLHWCFSGETIVRAYEEIMQERGKAACWYARQMNTLAEWERLPLLNGVTVARFRRIVKTSKQWNTLYWRKDPILSDGRRARLLVFRILRLLFVLPARLPVLEELFLGRICCELQKMKPLTDS